MPLILSRPALVMTQRTVMMIPMMIMGNWEIGDADDHYIDTNGGVDFCATIIVSTEDQQMALASANAASMALIVDCPLATAFSIIVIIDSIIER